MPKYEITMIDTYQETITANTLDRAKKEMQEIWAKRMELKMSSPLDRRFKHKRIREVKEVKTSNQKKQEARKGIHVSQKKEGNNR